MHINRVDDSERVGSAHNIPNLQRVVVSCYVSIDMSLQILSKNDQVMPFLPFLGVIERFYKIELFLMTLHRIMLCYHVNVTCQ